MRFLLWCLWFVGASITGTIIGCGAGILFFVIHIAPHDSKDFTPGDGVALTYCSGVGICCGFVLGCMMSLLLPQLWHWLQSRREPPGKAA